jgi:hypothetical protein
MSLKIENSRRVAKSRPVCMDLKAHASNSLGHATISSPSNLDGRMLEFEAIFVHVVFFLSLPLPPVVT